MNERLNVVDPKVQVASRVLVHPGTSLTETLNPTLTAVRVKIDCGVVLRVIVGASRENGKSGGVDADTLNYNEKHALVKKLMSKRPMHEPESSRCEDDDSGSDLHKNIWDSDRVRGNCEALSPSDINRRG